MTSDRDRRRRGGPAGRRDWQRWNGPNWNGSDWNSPGWNDGWYDESNGRSRRRDWGGDWHARGWSGDWRATAWNEADDNRWDDQRTGSSSDRLQDGRASTGEGSARGDVPRKRVRIGDAERDRAVSLLSDHFVAGRLTQAEFEERSEQATKARYSDEFEVLFDDLPTARELQPVPSAQLRRRPAPPPAFMMIAPFLMLGLVISSVALTAPWLLWGVFWVVMISGISRRRWNYRR
ncbi:hypothetical protein GCM10009630_69460 [Kribbella jejuensis]|uniref:Uncharacterized protein DUF1707 n=1 Tax=Kribbella jejuensis TaxID=236068 RepID=A0A542EQM7_9ACTN|nr:DUF1707 domain-containing protein [Kribbella jejuensis]TQJ17625.1 uncharacterized protein DUF1707 [Kribbella jejuensis]